MYVDIDVPSRITVYYYDIVIIMYKSAVSANARCYEGTSWPLEKTFFSRYEAIMPVTSQLLIPTRGSHRSLSLSATPPLKIS